MMEAAVTAFIGVKRKAPTISTTAREQAIGEFCGGSCLDDCTQLYGDGLWLACRHCPN